LLLATRHDLSDARLAEALDGRASFRRFCGFAAHEPTPERTAFVRFRRGLVRRGLDRMLFGAVTHQLEAKGVAVRTPDPSVRRPVAGTRQGEAATAPVPVPAEPAC
jgi:transposase, IS5 family